MAYGKARDSKFAEFSWPHGDKKVNPKIFNLSNSLSRVLTPGWVFNESKQSMIAFMFIEHGRVGSQPDPWVLTAFNPRNVPYYDFIKQVPLTLRESEEFSWELPAQYSECSMLGNLPDT